MSNKAKEQPIKISIECPTIVKPPIYVESSYYTSRTILPVRIGIQESYAERQSSRIDFFKKPAKQDKTKTLTDNQNGSSDNNHYSSQYDLPIERGCPKTFRSTKSVIIKFVNQNEKQ